EGLTAEELARAKQKLIGQQEIANQSNDAFGYHCALDELYGLGFDYYKQLEHDVNAITLEDIKRVAAKYFRDQPYVLATVRPLNRPGRSESGSCQNVHRSTGHDSGKNARKPDQRGSKSVEQRAFQFADGVCGSFAGTWRRANRACSPR